MLFLANGWAFQKSVSYCDTHLLFLKKIQFGLQWNNYSTFTSVTFFFPSSCHLPSLEFWMCFKVETLPTSQQRQQNRSREGTLFPLAYHESYTCGLLFLTPVCLLLEGLL